MAFELPKLDYAYNALEPHFDARTMEIHHTKHHQTYITKLNAEIESKGLADKSLRQLMRHVSKYSAGIRNNGGGHFNHSLFWTILSPNGGGEPKGKLAEGINEHFGSFDKFKELFAAAAVNQFGSGWAWLTVTSKGKMFVAGTPNQDNPLMDVNDIKGQPILGLDVWEHAYYLHYQNRRPDYIAAFWNLVNWDVVGKHYEGVISKQVEDDNE